MLRKCCNHPYLLEFPLTADEDLRVDEEMVTCCGKMLVLDRLLPALLKEGHKVRNTVVYIVDQDNFQLLKILSLVLLHM